MLETNIDPRKTLTLPQGGARSPIERRTPNAERRTPNAERRTPNAERRTPNAERRTPNAERRTPNAERRTPNAERRTPNAERRTPNAERRTPNAERRTPNAERRTPNAERRTLHPLTSSRSDRRPARRRARLLPALALLLGALSLFTAVPAQAQTTVWSATLTADQDNAYFGCDNRVGTQDNCSIALTDDDFTWKSVAYEVNSIYWDSGGNILEFSLRDSEGILTDSEMKQAFGSLTLNVNGTALAVNAATDRGNIITWPYDPAADWTDNQQVSVSLKTFPLSSLPPCTYSPGMPPPNLTSSEWPRELADLAWSTDESGSARELHRGDEKGLFDDSGLAGSWDFTAYVPFDEPSVWIRPTLPATPGGVLMTVESEDYYTGATVSAPMCAASGAAYKVALKPGDASKTTVRVKIGGDPSGSLNAVYTITFVKHEPLEVSFPAATMEVTEGEMARIRVQLDHPLHLNESIVVPLMLSHGTTDRADWYVDHSSAGGFIGRGQSTSRELLIQTRPEGERVRAAGDSNGVEHTDSGDETFTVSIDMTALQALTHLTVGPRALSVPGADAFAAGGHTTMTITIKEPTNGNADPNSIITGPGVVASATEVGVSVGGTATYTVKLGAPPTDIVVVTPTVDDGTKASVSPEQLVFTMADWSEAQTVTVSGAAAGETSIFHSVSTQDQALRFAIMPTVKVTVSATGQQGTNPNAALISQMVEWRNDPLWSSYKAHTDRWDRALLALGETVSDGNLTPMTAAEAQAFVDQGWTRWVTVAAALAAKEAENAGGSEPTSPYADLIAQMVEWRNDPQWSSYKSHTDRWDRALLAFGETVSDTTLTEMTAAEAQDFADSGMTRWVEVAKALKEIESAGNQPPTAPTATATVSLSAAPNTVAEGEWVRVTATLSTELPNAVTIPLTVSRGTSEDGDHGTLSEIVLPAGITSGTGGIKTTDDADADNETFTVALGSPLPSGVTAGSPSSVTITITDGDTTQQQSQVPYVPPDPDPDPPTGNQNPGEPDTQPGNQWPGPDDQSGTIPGESLLPDDQSGTIPGENLLDQDTPSGDESAQEDTSPVLVEGGPHSDMLEGDEGGDTIYGYGGHDVIFGYGGPDVIYGGPGNDVIYGGEGNDELHTGSGNDRLFGDSGADRFVVSSSDTGDKRVSDFDRGDGDRIVLKTEDGADDWPLKSDIIASASGDGSIGFRYDLGEGLDVVANTPLTADDFLVE